MDIYEDRDFEPPALSVQVMTKNTSEVEFDRMRNFLRLWHRRFGHPGHDVFMRLLKSNPCLSFFDKRRFKPLECEACELAKSKRAKLPSGSTYRAKSPLERVSTEWLGPFPNPIQQWIPVVHHLCG